MQYWQHYFLKHWDSCTRYDNDQNVHVRVNTQANEKSALWKHIQGLRKTWIPACHLDKLLSNFACPGQDLVCSFGRQLSWTLPLQQASKNKSYFPLGKTTRPRPLVYLTVLFSSPDLFVLKCCESHRNSADLNLKSNVPNLLYVWGIMWRCKVLWNACRKSTKLSCQWENQLQESQLS